MSGQNNKKQINIKNTQPGNTRGKTPEFSFIFATDLHFETREPLKTAEAPARLKCLIDDINRINPDFVLLGGDITQYGTIYPDEFITARAELDKLNMPCHLVAGNHDLAPSRKIAEAYVDEEKYQHGHILESDFSKVFGESGIRFSFIKNNIMFIGVSLRDKESSEILHWLNREIRKNDMPKIVMTHYGLYPPRTGGSPLELWGFSRIRDSIKELRNIIEQPGSGVFTYLYGHNHINSVIKKNGIMHISGGGIQKGCTGFWHFRCTGEYLYGQFRLLSEKKLLNFNYHGILHPEKCVDAAHTTVEEYHRGNAEEQSVKHYF